MLFRWSTGRSQVTRHCVLRALILVHRLPAPSNDATGEPDAPLRDANGNVIANNDNWKDSQQAAIAATGKAPPNDNISAILGLLAPGNYTAIVAGKNGTTGVALIEFYSLP